jgi:hypothetical protein
MNTPTIIPLWIAVPIVGVVSIGAIGGVTLYLNSMSTPPPVEVIKQVQQEPPHRPPARPENPNLEPLDDWVQQGILRSRIERGLIKGRDLRLNQAYKAELDRDRSRDSQLQREARQRQEQAIEQSRAEQEHRRDNNQQMGGYFSH